VVQIRVLERVHMRHEVENAVVLQHAPLGGHGDVVARLDGQFGVDFDVRVDHDQVPHLARPQVVHVPDAGRSQERASNGVHLDRIRRPVHQFLQGAPGDLPAGFRDQQSHDQRRDRIEDGVSPQIADDADQYDERGGRVGSGMPGVRDQQARFDALGDLQHVPKEKFLGDQRGGRHPQRGDLDVRDGARRFELADRRQQHGDAHRDQQGAQRERRGRFETLVPVRMILVGRLLAVVARDEHDEVGHQVREGMDAIRHQALRSGDDSHRHLGRCQQHVDGDAQPRGARQRARGRESRSLIQVVVVEGGCRRIHAALYRQYRP